MLSKCYESFILECIRILEDSELYREKLMRLKKMAKFQDRYIGIMADALLEFFYCNDHYRNMSHLYNKNDEKDISFMVDSLIHRYEKECRTYILDVAIDGFENMISRTIQVPHDATIGTLGYAVLASLGCQHHEFYMSHGVDDHYPAFSDQKLHFTEKDPFESYLSEFVFDAERLEMSYCGLIIGIQLKEIRMVSDFYVPQTYQVLDGIGLDLCIQENRAESSAKVVLNESPINVPMDIRKSVEHLLYEYECSFLVPPDEESEDEFEEQ